VPRGGPPWDTSHLVDRRCSHWQGPGVGQSSAEVVVSAEAQGCTTPRQIQAWRLFSKLLCIMPPLAPSPQAQMWFCLSRKAGEKTAATRVDKQIHLVSCHTRHWH
jgi:hypothetical protein